MTGDELRALRKRTGMGQAQFGAVLGLSGPYIGELERGEKAISEALALAAEMTMERFTIHRVSTGRFGDKYVVIVTKKIANGRSHEVQTPTYDDADAAARAAIALADELDADLHLGH